MSKVIVKMKDAEPLELPEGNITIAQPGVFVVQSADDQVLGVFPIHSTLGIYKPEGAPLIQPVSALVS